MILSLSLLFAALSTTALAADMTAYAGTWNVTVTSEGYGTCSSVTPLGTTSSFIWLANTTPTAGVSVAVQGTTSFPKLDGKVTGTDLVLMGYSQFQPVGTVKYGSDAWYKLQLQADGTLKGMAQALSYMTVPLADGSSGIAPCFIISSVTAKR